MRRRSPAAASGRAGFAPVPVCAAVRECVSEGAAEAPLVGTGLGAARGTA